VLAAENDQFRRVSEALIDAVRLRDAQAARSAEDRPSRREQMLQAGLYHQGERISIIEFELRQRIDELQTELRREHAT